MIQPPIPMSGNRSDVLGLSVSQIPHITCIISKMFKDMKPQRILEIGTAHGGLSVLLKIIAINMNATFKTYDIKNHVQCENLFNQLGIEQEIGNIFDKTDEVGKLVSEEGQTILFCDGGNKSKEMNEFIPYLKKGDVILAHDYFENDDIASKNRHIWPWHESKYSDFKITAEKYRVIPYKKDLMQSAGWGCFIKE